MRAGVAAGHPATAEAGAEILAEGGSAADSAVAACLASCVAETVMTGLLGGGHAIYLDAGSSTVENLDCFVAVPGLGAPPSSPKLVELQVPFGDGARPLRRRTRLVRRARSTGRVGSPLEPFRTPPLDAASASRRWPWRAPA